MMERWSGHFAGMLDRDQRTARTCSCDRNVVFAKGYEAVHAVLTLISRRNEPVSHRSVPGRTSPHSSCKTRKNGHFWKSLHRLRHALLVGAYLSLVTFPGILAAPTLRGPMSKVNADPKWLNPCGSSNGGGGGGHSIPEKQLLMQIWNQAHIASSKAEAFKEELVQGMFNTNYGMLNQFYKDKDYEWLPTSGLPKKLGEMTPIEHLQSLELKPTLLDVYEYLQTMAVGLEQIVEDEKKREGSFQSKFMETEHNLILLLCEINTVIMEKELVIEEDVSRDVMGPEFRNMDNTSMNLRNWIIYRDYLNMLEYTKDVFQYFVNNPPSSH